MKNLALWKKILFIFLTMITITSVLYFFKPFIYMSNGKDLSINEFVGLIYVSSDGMFGLQVSSKSSAILQFNKIENETIVYGFADTFVFSYSEGYFKADNPKYDVISFGKDNLWLVEYKKYLYKFGENKNEK